MHDRQTRLVLAELQGELQHRARWEPLAPDEMAAAADAVREILAGRDDGPALLACAAGIIAGARSGSPEDRKRGGVVVSVCVAAGADEGAIAGWAEVGARRRADADRPPFGSKVLGS